MTNQLRIALVVPHIFMQQDILPQVIFSPGQLAIELANGLVEHGHDVTLFTPGPIGTKAHNSTADLHLFEQELANRGDDYLALLKKHPFTFVTLARQVQSELVAAAYKRASNGEFDIVHIYANEEDIALPYADLCTKPVVFTHHDPFNFMVKYKNNLPKYAYLNWISFSFAQRKGMPQNTNWVGNVYHGFSDSVMKPVEHPTADYIAYLGRIIEPKGVHLAINALNIYNQNAHTPLKLKLAGRHYSDSEKKSYWTDRIQPQLSEMVEYIGFINNAAAKQAYLANAKALLVPSVFEEPFGMVAIEALACGTPVIALDSGALPEVIQQDRSGIIVNASYDTDGLDETDTAKRLAESVNHIDDISRQACRAAYEHRFSRDSMVDGYTKVYRDVIKQNAA